jgi:hypothetical protein
MGDTNKTAASFFQDCSVTNSQFRCYTVHGTNATRLSRNVAYNVWGMCYYLEDGVEERNLLEYNMAAHVHPISIPADGGGSQAGQSFAQSTDLFLPADVSASGFYAPNAYNYWYGNTASGGWSGYAFPNTPAPLGDFKGTIASTSNWAPWTRPLLQFYGNTVHSSGFYWSEYGSGVYIGAMLTIDVTTGVMAYDSGRYDRDTKYANGTSAIMTFEHTKAFLCNRGLSHWGNTPLVLHSEFHDVRVSSMLFGSASMVNALVNARTPNHDTNIGNVYVLTERDTVIGFQFYDTWVQTILVNITFRNFTGASDYAIRYMDHSDHYLPQGINAVLGLRFEDTPVTSILGIQNCGVDCGTPLHTTQSSRIYSVWDFDGSMSRRGRPTIIGSHGQWYVRTHHSHEPASLFDLLFV